MFLRFTHFILFAFVPCYLPSCLDSVIPKCDLPYYLESYLVSFHVPFYFSSLLVSFLASSYALPKSCPYPSFFPSLHSLVLPFLFFFNFLSCEIVSQESLIPSILGVRNVILVPSFLPSFFSSFLSPSSLPSYLYCST